MRLDGHFVGYDIDEGVSLHSNDFQPYATISWVCFESVFTKVLHLCIEKGMVSGHTQTIDSAPVKANASMDTL
jgi:hypothetical protein